MSSSLTSFWEALFYPVVHVGCVVLLLRFILGKQTFGRIKSKAEGLWARVKTELRYEERLGKVTPVINVFIVISAIYFFSIVFSVIESFIALDIATVFNRGFFSIFLAPEIILNVWQYHPYIDSFDLLRQLVLYQAGESELNTFKSLSIEGIKALPYILVSSLIVFSMITGLVCVFMTLIRIAKKGLVQRLKKIGRAAVIIVLFVFLLTGISLVKGYEDSNNEILAWERYELKLLASGPPPESSVALDKREEVNWAIESYDNSDLSVTALLRVGSVHWVFRWSRNGFSYEYYAL